VVVEDVQHPEAPAVRQLVADEVERPALHRPLAMRAAHEIEMQKRATAEARVVKIEARIAMIRAACDDLDEEGYAGPVMEAPAETDAETIRRPAA